MVEGFSDASDADREAVEEAVGSSRIDRRIAALIGAAERMLSGNNTAEDREAQRHAAMAHMFA